MRKELNNLKKRGKHHRTSFLVKKEKKQLPWYQKELLSWRKEKYEKQQKLFA